MKKINEIFSFEKGSLQSTKSIPGNYNFITASEEWKTHNSFTHECEALVFASSASGSLGRIHYINGKFIASDLCYILTPKKKEKVDLVFYWFVFIFLKEDIVKKTSTGTSKLAINSKNFGNYELPYFDYKYQGKNKEKLLTIDKLRNKLNCNLEKEINFLKQLRQAVLQEAVEGKITADWRKKHFELTSGENSAKNLLKKIKIEKEQLIKEKKIKNQKSFLPISEEEKPFKLPEDWVWTRLGKVIKISSGDGLTSKEMEKDGNVPVYGGNGIAGYHNKPNVSEQTIVIGRVGAYCGSIHLTESKAWITDNAFIVFFNKNYINENWLLTLLKSLKLRKKARETAQPVISGKRTYPTIFGFPPLDEQQIIANRLDSLMNILDELEKQVNEQKKQTEQLIHSVLRETFEQK
jgi:type I restriction enzyme S subunit